MTPWQALFNKADQALYEAKRKGKSRYAAFGQDD